MKTAARNEKKQGRSIVWGKRSVLRFDLKESREGFWRRGTKNRKGARTNSTKPVTRNLECEKQSGEYGRVCKVEDSHRVKTEQCAWYIYSRLCLSSTEFFVGLGASREIETGVMLSVLCFSVWDEQHSSCSATLALHQRFGSTNAFPSIRIPLIPQCLHSTDTPMSAFHWYPNGCIPLIPQWLHSTDTPMSAFYWYPNGCIPLIPRCLHSTDIPVSPFHWYLNVCIPHILQCLHSTLTLMSTFHTYPNVCILKIS